MSYTSGGSTLNFGTSNSYASGITNTAMTIDPSGNVTPGGNGTQDFGSATTRWRNIYTSDLNLSNDYGSWTIVEGAEELFIHNNKNGKVFKFALIEVDPSDSPPKIGTE
jgi:hypothetical protein